MTTPPSSPKGPPPEPSRPGVVGAIRLAKVLLVGAGRDDLRSVDQALEGRGAVAVHAQDLREARRRLQHDDFDVVLVDAGASTDAALDFTRRLTADDEVVMVVLCAPSPTYQQAVRAMQAGAIDLLALPLNPEEVGRSVDRARERAERPRQRRRKLERLRRICRRLSNSRQQASQQVDEMAGDLVNVYQELEDHMGQVTMSTEFTALVRKELDVESLLRTTLEYLLTKTGPTNAAVFLPTGHADWSLGAYVNYDLPKDTAEVLLDHLADALPHRFQSEYDIVPLDTPGKLAEALGPTAPWLADSHMLAFACHDEQDRCLAVAAIFRGSVSPFGGALLPKIELIRELFTDQLARIIRLHHRHKPGADWTGFDVAQGGEPDEGDDDQDHGWGMAA